MKRYNHWLLIPLILFIGFIVLSRCVKTRPEAAMPSDGSENFVTLTDAVPDAILEIRYFSTYNFVGKRIDGYLEPTALMTKVAADSLRAVSDDVKAQGYRLKIYDAYRPQMAVNHFVRWAENITDTLMKRYFYPGVDLTLFDMQTEKELDMGGTFDWFGHESHPDFGGNPDTMEYLPNDTITAEQFAHRMILRQAMLRHGFRPLSSEWWHFTLDNEPFPDTYFNFPVKLLNR